MFKVFFSLVLVTLFLSWELPNVKSQTNALTFPDITTALNTKLPNKYFKTKADLMSWLIIEIKKRKVDKPLTADREADLRQIGATDQLIQTIKANSPTFKNPALANPPYRMEFVRIPAGSFMMGADNFNYNEKPVHKVTITKDFWMQKTEVTQAQWKAIMVTLPETSCANRGENSLGDNKPVTCISWDKVQEFIKVLNAKKDGYKYRLPTEAEWEYAARAGTTGDYAGELNEMAWFGMDAQDGHPYDVATKKANAYGLFDMHGNVSEWVSDWYNDKYYEKSPATNPTGPPTAGTKSIRGGAWVSNRNYVRSAIRLDEQPSSTSPLIGFRVVREK